MLHALTSIVAQQGSGGYKWMPERASSYAAEVDWAFNFVFWISVFFFALIVILTVVFAIKYRRRPGVEADNSITHNTKLEVFWSVVPLGLVIVIFWFGFSGFVDMRTFPKDAMVVKVHAKMWSWSFEYPNGVESTTLHVPLGQKVKLRMDSSDVLHSFWVPAFRVKQDVVPGRYTYLWFEAIKTGTFRVLCTEYCGTGHSTMLSAVEVQSPEAFKAWMAEESSGKNLSPVERGKKVFSLKGCAGCHTVTKDRKKLVGPGLYGIFGHEVTLAGGKKVLADENYLRESILDPNAKVVNGFPPIMSLIPLKDKELDGVIEYLKSLKD